MMNKRGLSEVVTTVLIILLAIVAIGIVWVVVKNVIKTGGEGIAQGAECMALDLEITNASYILPNSTIISVKKNPGTATLSKIRLLIDGIANDNSTTLPGEGETRTYIFKNLPKPTKIEIAGFVGGSNSPCKISDTKEANEIF